MTEKLEKILKEYDFEGDFEGDFNLTEVLTETISYIKKLEKDNKGLEEIISIQRHNLSLLRKVKCK